MRNALPVAKALYKQYWGCALGNCNLSMQDWTGSVDVSGMWAWGITARGTISIAVDHTGNIAFVTSAGGGGSTPVENLGLGITATNAPSVEKLSGYSVQAGGSIDAGVGVMAEGVFFSDSQTNQPYYGLSISGIGSFPTPLVGSVHGTFEHSWLVGKGNVIDLLYLPLEWYLRED